MKASLPGQPGDRAAMDVVDGCDDRFAKGLVGVALGGDQLAGDGVDAEFVARGLEQRRFPHDRMRIIVPGPAGSVSKALENRSPSSRRNVVHARSNPIGGAGSARPSGRGGFVVIFAAVTGGRANSQVTPSLYHSKEKYSPVSVIVR